MKEKVSILITKDGVSYHFAEIKIVSDGSLEIAFPTIKENTGIVQSIQISKQGSSLLSSNCVPQKNEKQYYVSYHTSGKVNYHKMTFQSAFMEPLYDVHEANPFFIYSFIYPEIAFKNPDNKTRTNAVSIDISDFSSKRIDIVLSVCPAAFQPKHSNSFVISYPLYSLCVEIVDDETSFNFAQVYQETDCVKFRPHLDKFLEQPTTKENAFLAYSHALYQTKEAIVFPPNGEGVLKIIFAVEMRIPPWLHFEFQNPDFCVKAEDIKRNTTQLTFKIFDRKRNQYIKKAENIQITRLWLDAEIYDDDSIAPPDCI